MDKNIDKSKFKRVNSGDQRIFDQKFETKAEGYYKDAFRRFIKNRVSVVAAFIIVFLLLFSIFGSIFSRHDMDYRNRFLNSSLIGGTPRPKIPFLAPLGIADGTTRLTITHANYNVLNGIGLSSLHHNEETVARYTDLSQARGARYNPVVRLISYHYTPPNLAAVEGRYRYVLNQFINQQVYWHRNPAARDMTLAELMELPGFPFDNIPGYLLRSTGNFTIRLDTYLQLGFLYRTISPERYNEIRAFESRTGMRVIFPMIDNDRYFNPDAHPNDRVVRNPRPHDANVWWRYELDADVLVENYLWRYRYVLDADGNFVYNGTERETERYLATFITNIDGIERSVRVLYYNYYYFLNGRHPVYWFGLNQSGEDIFILLVVGIRTSFALAILVAAMILVLGVILGAIQGYFGGWVDLIGQRITEIIDFIPFVVVSMLFVFYLGTIVPAFMTLVILYVFTSWTGMANLTRLQFYRFKGREYVLAARTLGARDRRLMFRHILPNGIGMIITSAVMLIPAVIVGEATLAFLGIIDITGGTFLGFGGASLGSMLTQGQEVLMRLPHVVLFPSIAISLIMISFNLFGNGLRDALNPALRGKE